VSRGPETSVVIPTCMLVPSDGGMAAGPRRASEARRAYAVKVATGGEDE
jgi:hypothetical protein